MVSSHEMELLAQQLHHAHRAAVQRELAAAGLSEVGHPMLLTILKSYGPTGTDAPCPAQRDLAQLLHISPAAVANPLKSLEKGRYIQRQPSQGDARRNQVTLTQLGAAAVQSCDQIFDRVGAQMLEGFSPQEREQLTAFRRRMLDNLRKASPNTQ